MGINKGQGSLEYLFMIAAVLVIVLMVFRALGGISISHPMILTVFPDTRTPVVYDGGNFKVEAWVEENSTDGTYKVLYRIWALKKPITRANVELVCFGPLKDVAGKGPITHTGPLEPVNYWANYWTPVYRKEFPCRIEVTVWTRLI